MMYIRSSRPDTFFFTLLSTCSKSTKLQMHPVDLNNMRNGRDHFCERQSVLKKTSSPPFVYMSEYER